MACLLYFAMHISVFLLHCKTHTPFQILCSTSEDRQMKKKWFNLELNAGKSIIQRYFTKKASYIYLFFNTPLFFF